MRKNSSILQVLNNRCDECLFSPNHIVSQKRKELIIEQTLDKDRYFTCHKAMIAGRDLCCRGFFDIHKYDSLVTRLAIQLNLVEFVDLGDPKQEYNRLLLTQ